MMKFGKALLIILLAASLTACASSDKKASEDIIPTDSDVKDIYNTGLAHANAGDLQDAVKKFEEIDKVAPQSDEARKAMIMQAYANYRLGRYAEAITASNRFVTLFPGNKDAAYAQFIIGESYFAQIPGISRDQEVTKKAQRAYSELINRYPDSEYVPTAKKKLFAVEDQLAGKEMDVGRYYQIRHNHAGAINRFRQVVTQYQTTRHVEEALARLVESYLSLGVAEEAQAAAAILGHNFPDSRWYTDSYALLKKAGLEPKKSDNSWLNNAM